MLTFAPEEIKNTIRKIMIYPSLKLIKDQATMCQHRAMQQASTVLQGSGIL